MACHECDSSRYWQEGRTNRAIMAGLTVMVLGIAGALTYATTPSPKPWHPDEAMAEAFAAIRDDRVAHWNACKQVGHCPTCDTLSKAEADATRARTEFIKSYRFRAYDRISDAGRKSLDEDR